MVINSAGNDNNLIVTVMNSVCNDNNLNSYGNEQCWWWQ